MSVPSEVFRYTELGWHLIPVQQQGKRPLVDRWQERATTDRSRITDWWSNTPGANVGVVAGPSGLAIVDIDGERGQTLFDEVMGDSPVPACPTVTTGNGIHLYFSDPGGLKPKAEGGLDLRAGNSLAILPPSIHPNGTQYCWLRAPWDVTPPAMPPALIQHFQGRRAKPSAAGPIHEGARNDTLYREACRLRQKGLTEDDLEEKLLEINAERCSPPLDDDEVRGIAASAATHPAGSGEQPQMERLIALADHFDLYRTPDQRAFASVQDERGRENWLIVDKQFALRLRREYFDRHGRAPRGQPLSEALLQIEAHALFGGETRPLHVRVAGEAGAVYLDLADERRQVVRITPTGWKLEAAPGIAFRRPDGLRPLPIPTRGGAVDQLRGFVNVADDAAWRLLVGWLVAALQPEGPYPVLVLSGEQGSAKSTCAKLIRSLVDPNVAPLRGGSNNVRDLMVSATNAWCIVMDNISFISPDMSDALCRLATGGGFSSRSLYTNDQESILDAQRPVILTGIGDMARRSDLLDRALIIRLPPIPETARRTETDLWAEFEEARPRILGALLDAVAGSLARSGEVRLERLPRMADFAIRVTAAEQALEWPDGAFMDAYRTGRADANSVALEASPVTAALDRVVGHTGLQMTAEALLKELEKAFEDGNRPKGWPANGQSLSTTLNRLSPNLREAGWDIEQSQTSGNGSRKVWEIRRPA